MPYWDKNGQPIELLQWGTEFSNWEYKLVADEEFIGNDGTVHRVTTVWLGDNFEDELRDPDCANKPGYVPRIFGTLIRPAQSELRHHTLDEAKKNHDIIVQCLKSGDLETLNKMIEDCGV